jgi:hypothetical protein
MNKLLGDYAKKVQTLGFQPVPIAAGLEKKPPSWFCWTDLRDRKRPALTYQEIESMFSNPEVGRVGIILDKRSLVIDYDGALGEKMLWNEFIPRCSQELQRLLRSTTHTKTPHGAHILVMLDGNVFPEGIEEILCWQLLANGHANGNAEIRILSQNKYSIEYGEGYESIRDIKEIVTLSKRESIELVEIGRCFKLESTTIRNIANSLLPYWAKGRRQDLTLAIAGYLYKNNVNVDVTRCLVLYLGQITDDEELQMRLDAVKGTYTKKVEEVSGYNRLLELVDENESIIQKIKKQFSRLGYRFYDDNADPRTGSESNDSSNSATELLTIVKPEIVELFKDQLNNPFAAIRINGHFETMPIPASSSSKFKMWVCKTYYEKEQKVLSNGETIAAVCNTLRAKALFGDVTKTLNLRVSNGNDASNKAIYYDLTNKDCQVVKITESGWSVENSNDVPIIFRRYQNQRAQVIPSKEYPPNILDKFLNLINIEDGEGTRLLLKCYIITLFIPDIAKAALMLHGPESAGKTACQELIKSVVDPSVIPTLTFPRDIDGLIQQFSHNYVAYYDNVSILPEWLSDALCRAVTGTGFSKRELYSDDDDVIYQFLRCIGFNGINLAATKSDLLDRGIIMGLKRIDDKEKKIRELKGEILPEFEKILPQLLGYIFDILVRVLRVMNNGGIEIKAKSRMADFEKYAEIISQCMDYEPMKFINAYHENKKLKTDNVLETSPVAKAVIEFMETRERWRGTNPELLAELESVTSSLKINTQRERLWPKAANVLGRRLNEIKSNLEEVGIMINESKDPIKRTVILEICKIPLESFEPFENKNLRSADPELLKDIPKDMLGDEFAISFKTTQEGHMRNQESKDTKDMKYILQPLYGNQDIDRISSSRSETYICQWCRIIHNRIVIYQTSDFLEKHTVNKHAGWTAYPGPADIEKFEQKQKEKLQLKRNMETESD